MLLSRFRMKKLFLALVVLGSAIDTSLTAPLDYEILLEGTYQIELTPWLGFQPDLQYVIHPSGTDITNALVLRARTTMSF